MSETQQTPPPLDKIATMDEYLRNYGRILAGKAIKALDPLHVPDRDPLPDFSDLYEDRMPFEPQKHVIAATMKMLDSAGSGFMCGEMGTGKTLMGMLAVHKHAAGKPYRAAVLCPDHLIKKWKREIEDTIPGAVVHIFDNWKGMMVLLDKGHEFVKDDGKFRRRIKRWKKPTGPEWFIIGRNQAKFYPEWAGLGKNYHRFDGTKHPGDSYKHVVVEHVPKVDEEGRPVLDSRGMQVEVPIIDKAWICPRCGDTAKNKKGEILGEKSLDKEKQHCRALWLQQIVTEEDQGEAHKIRGLLRLPIDAIPTKSVEVGKVGVYKGVRYRVERCNEPLWQFTRKPYRWAPAHLIQKKCEGMIKYLLIDECHEQKSDESAQSMAAGKLMSASKHVLALTGTLIGGYANHLFPLMLRMTPKSLRDEGFEWAKDLPFSEVYGRIDRIATTKMDDGGDVTVSRSVSSMRKARTGRATERKAVRPGIMPTMFGRHLIGSSLFITLEELADELPELDEFVEDGACDMDPEVAAEYARVESALDSACKDLLDRGSMKLLGAMLYTLLDYPDHPYGWFPEHDGEHSVGYYEKPKVYTKENWRGVVTPADLGYSLSVVRPKERKLLDICKAEVAEGRQVWVYVQMTGKRNVQPRLRDLLEKQGLRVGVLRRDTVDPKQREDWIRDNGTKYDVIISHPKLVCTGLDFFSKDPGGHNYSTIVFYETGYDLFTMRQAARRAWRIGQPLGCKVHYLYYRNTMQHRAMQLMSRKMAAAAALEGELSVEGLVALAGDDNAQMALARTLSEKIDDGDMQRSWSKVKSKSGNRKNPDAAIAAMTPRPVVHSPFDDLPMTVQLVAETMMDHPENPIEDHAIEPAPVADPKPRLKIVAREPEPDPEPAEEEDRPKLTREILAKMFQNLMDNGVELDEFLKD